MPLLRLRRDGGGVCTTAIRDIGGLEAVCEPIGGVLPSLLSLHIR
jgi:hypothetical protein